jgi:hypothetical protein
MREGVWRVDVEVARDPETGRYRRVARVGHGSREDAEIAVVRLNVVDHEKRLPRVETIARSIRAAFQLSLQSVNSGPAELAPRTRVAVRSAANTMAAIEFPDGPEFGDIRFSRRIWQDIESLYTVVRVDRAWHALDAPMCDRA